MRFLTFVRNDCGYHFDRVPFRDDEKSHILVLGSASQFLSAVVNLRAKLRFWLSHSCDFSSLSLCRNDCGCHFDRVLFQDDEKSHILVLGGMHFRYCC